MTAKSIRVKRSVLDRLNGSTGNSYIPPKLPKSPKVTVGPRSYGVTKKGRHVVIRFFVTRKRGDVWLVYDSEEGGIALGTEEIGYTKDKAIQVARILRDEYGEWATMPF